MRTYYDLPGRFHDGLVIMERTRYITVMLGQSSNDGDDLRRSGTRNGENDENGDVFVLTAWHPSTDGYDGTFHVFPIR